MYYKFVKKSCTTNKRIVPHCYLIPISTNLYMLIGYLEYQQVASGINKHMMKTEQTPSNELASTGETTQNKSKHRRDIKY